MQRFCTGSGGLRGRRILPDRKKDYRKSNFFLRHALISCSKCEMNYTQNMFSFFCHNREDSMKIDCNTRILFKFILACLFGAAPVAWADQDLEEIQRRFNQETISKPFSVPDMASLDASLKAATERGTPTKSPPYVAPNIPFLGGFGRFGYVRPYYGGLYGAGYYNPYYGGWW
jgi:hypothetical protein